MKTTNKTERLLLVVMIQMQTLNQLT